MEFLYFACDWIVNRNFIRLALAVRELDCGLVTLGYDRKSEAGWAIQTFAIRVQAETTLEEFNTVIGSEIGMNNWYPITMEAYAEGMPFLWDESDDIRTDIKTRIVDSYFSLAGYNEWYRKKMEG